MARDFERMVRGTRGIFLPAWVVGLIGFVLLSAAGLTIVREPVYGLQVVTSPDGAYTARVQRRRYVKDYFRVQLRDGHFWQTVWSSPTVTADLSEDLGDRLRWSEDLGGFEFTLGGKVLWSQPLLRRP